MKALAHLSLLVLVRAALGHGVHEDFPGPAEGETIQQYAQRHMASEHHIDSFDVGSFFQLHDLNGDGVWDREEIEAIYGVHHVYSQKKSKDDVEHQKKADHIVNTVLLGLDSNGDGVITLNELEKVGLDGLPNFDSMGAEGHHYDIESEFFLHHEEQFHSTPETQTDESYNHPEDLEHFAHHEFIELKEAEKEAKFAGVTVDEVLKAHDHANAPLSPPDPHPDSNPNPNLNQAAGDAQHPPHPHDEQIVPEPSLANPPSHSPPKPKITRVTPPEKQDPATKYQGAVSEGNRKGEWGTGEAGYKPPTDPSDKMRKNLPYKGRMQYKFRRNWGDF